MQPADPTNRSWNATPYTRLEAVAPSDTPLGSPTESVIPRLKANVPWVARFGRPTTFVIPRVIGNVPNHHALQTRGILSLLSYDLWTSTVAVAVAVSSYVRLQQWPPRASSAEAPAVYVSAALEARGGLLSLPFLRPLQFLRFLRHFAANLAVAVVAVAVNKKQKTTNK